MTGTRIDTFEVPNCLARCGEVLVQKATAVFIGKNTCKAPLGIFLATNIVDVND